MPTPEHWQRRWADTGPDFRWAPEPPGPPVILDERVAALHAAISASDEPAILVAHSAGCLVTAMWAATHTGPTHAALLVTPPCVSSLEPGAMVVPWPVIRRRLPFRAVLVASRTDPYSTFPQFEQLAEDWGATLVDAGDAGHLDTASGFGPWPDGERLVDELR